MVQIPLVARDQVIHRQDLMTFLEQAIRKVGTQKSRPPRNHTDRHSYGLGSFLFQRKPWTRLPPAFGACFPHDGTQDLHGSLVW